MAWEFDIGLLGGGQLARMSIQAAQRMGLRCLSLDARADTPASGVADSIVGPLNSPEHIAQVLQRCEKVTLENEFVPADAIKRAFDQTGRDDSAILPGLTTLATIQDKLLQAQAYERAGVPTPKTQASMEPPCVAKSRTGGYDGKGVRIIEPGEEIPEGWMAQELIGFRRELAVMAYRSKTETGIFPTMESIQVDGVCDLVLPCDADASEIAIAAVEAVEGYGLFGVELFETRSGELLVNEIAPRPHNSGHYTLDWGGVSQFEQHIRLTLGLPCAKPSGQPACMANLFGQLGTGDFHDGIRAALGTIPDCHVHWYGKADARPGRKLGHINAVGPNCRERAERARDAFYKA